MNDIPLAFRRLRQTRSASAAIALSLGLGIGITTAIFSLVDGLLLQPLPVREPDRLVTVSSSRALELGITTGLGWNLPTWLRMEERAATFDGALAWGSGDIAVGAGADRRTHDGLFTSGTFFQTLGISAQAGRVYGAADDVPGGGPDGPVAVISDRFWEREFGRDRKAIGSSLALGRGMATIIGVTPPDFIGIDLGRAFDVAVPLGIEPALRGGDSIVRAPNQFLLTFMIRLRPGQSLAAAEQAIHAIQPDLIAGMNVPQMAKEPIRLVPAANGADRYRLRWSYQRPVLAVFVAAVLAFLVACANIANLMFARAAGRTHEISVRLALGAMRFQLARQLAAEGLLLAAAGALVGLVVASSATRAIAAFLAGSWAIEAELAPDWRVLAFVGCVAVVATVLLAAVPVGVVVRTAPAAALRGHGQRAGSGRSRAPALFVTMQVALSMMLVVVTGLFAGTFGRLLQLPLGFLADRVLVVDVQMDGTPPAGERAGISDRLVQAAAGVPGVVAAAASRLTPLSQASNSLWAEQKDVDLRNAVTPGWFATYGTPVHAGRDFDARDIGDAERVAIVNDAYRRKHFPDRDPIGEVVDGKTVVGIVGDAVFSTVRAGMRPTVYEPLAQASVEPRDRRLSVSVRVASGVPSRISRAVTASLFAASPGSILTARPLSDDVAASIAQERLLAALSGVFAVLALALAGLGLYGLMSHLVTERRREIGVRIALGAQSRDVVRLVLGRALILVIVGVALGAAGSAWTSGLVGSLLYGLGPRDTTTLSGAAAVLVAVGLLAAWLPARRAAATNPAETLRST